MEVFEMVMQMERQEGEMKGRKERDTFFVGNLLRSTNFIDERIAFLAGVSVEFVAEVRAKLHLN